MGFEINNSDNIQTGNGSSKRLSDQRPIFTTELIQRCLNRPTDEVAWVEFIHRFTPIIRTAVEKSFQLKKAEGETKKSYNGEMIEAVVQIVYSRLTENRSKALNGIEDTSLKPFLQLVSINATRDYLRIAKLF